MGTSADSGQVQRLSSADQPIRFFRGQEVVWETVLAELEALRATTAADKDVPPQYRLFVDSIPVNYSEVSHPPTFA